MSSSAIEVGGGILPPPPPQVPALPLLGRHSSARHGSNPQELHSSTYNAGPPQASSISLLVPAGEELYPTVTLHSPMTAVMCRFSSHDIVATNRMQIGAPTNVTVYAVDGSVIFD
jgi:hypothetical protein